MNQTCFQEPEFITSYVWYGVWNHRPLDCLRNNLPRLITNQQQNSASHPFWGNPPLADSPHKGSGMRKDFPVMTSKCRTRTCTAFGAQCTTVRQWGNSPATRLFVKQLDITKKASELRIACHLWRNPLVTDGFPSQTTSKRESVTISWHQ